MWCDFEVGVTFWNVVPRMFLWRSKHFASKIETAKYCENVLKIVGTEIEYFYLPYYAGSNILWRFGTLKNYLKRNIKFFDVL